MTDLAALVRVLEQGGVVACPTETWLGLLADARSEKALERVAELKGRPADMPIALLLPTLKRRQTWLWPLRAAARALMEAYWPGPLTILLAAKPGLEPTDHPKWQARCPRARPEPRGGLGAGVRPPPDRDQCQPDR